MKPEVETFDAELQRLIQDADGTIGLANRAGNNIAHETNLLNQLRSTIEQNSDARHELLEALTRPQRVPLSETRRQQLASSITRDLPRMYGGNRQHAAPQPPPIPRDYDEQYQPPHGAYAGQAN
jgi:hypothetical protein